MLTKYQQQQIEYIKKSQDYMKQHPEATFDTTIECRTCKEKTENLTDPKVAIEYIKQHESHFTWTTNNNLKK